MNIKTPLNKLKFIGNILPKMDNRGALLIPLSLKVKDLEFAHYRHIPINWNIEAVMPKCLPKDFSKNAVKIVDMFRRKTIDLDYEIMLIFDYKTAELLYCFVNEESGGDEVSGQVDEEIFAGHDIAVIHNHPKNYGSSPSNENFQILDLTFQDYEILSSWDGIWIIESKEPIPIGEIRKIKYKIQQFYEYSWEIVENMDGGKMEMIKQFDTLYGNLLITYINNYPLNIKLTKKVLKHED